MKGNDPKENLGFKGIGKKLQKASPQEYDHPSSPAQSPIIPPSDSIEKEVERIRRDAEAALERERAEKEAKARESDHAEDTDAAEKLKKRELCKDGSCIGIIGVNGRCSECGRTPEEVHAEGSKTKQQPICDGSKKRPWVIAAVVLGVIFLIAFLTFEPQPARKLSPPSPQVTTRSPSPSVPAPGPALKPKPPNTKVVGLTFYKPPVGTNNTLNLSQLRWCARERIRIEVMGRVLPDDSDAVDKFNRIVDEYNSCCSKFRYRKGDVEQAKREVEKIKDQVVAEAKLDAMALGLADVQPEQSPPSKANPSATPASSINQVIVEVQEQLTLLGYDPGPSDGQYGRRTIAAIKAFQRDHGRNQNGRIDQQLLTLLERKKDDHAKKIIDLGHHGTGVKQPPTEYNPQPASQSDVKTSYAEQSLPHSGSVLTFTKGERVAPFEIKAAQGSHYLLKLVDANTYAPVLTVFVRSGTTVNVDVPLGTYEVRYASGEKWYGYEYLFGPKTAYSKADKTFSFKIVGNQISGFTITLYKVAHGNLHTSKIAPKEF